MEYTLQDTDIFDENIGEKFKATISDNKEDFTNGNPLY